MLPPSSRPSIAIVSPFLDKRHGTERRVSEWIAQLAPSFDIHLYSHSVQDLDTSVFAWRRIPKLPGPHLVNYLWWFAANHAYRAWDRSVRRKRMDLVFSPGINCFDADVISVHIVFAEYFRKNKLGLQWRRNPVRSWPLLLHRRLYYRLLRFLESLIYSRADNTLLLIARHTAAALEEFYGRSSPFPVIYLGLDPRVFSRDRRLAQRAEARKLLGIPEDRFTLLLIGNDLASKGLPVLIAALAQLRSAPIDLLCVTAEEPSIHRAKAREHLPENRVRILPPRKDVELYYAAADAYAGPSMEDTFAQPPAEAMACGLPVIVSAANGASEIITDGLDGMILREPTDAATLAAMIQRLYEDPSLRTRLGENAARIAAQYTWERNGQELAAIFHAIVRGKAAKSAAQAVPSGT